MLTGISVVNDRRPDDIALFSIDGSSGYLLEDVTGLEPTKAILNHTDFATMDGGVFHSGTSDIRNLVLTVSFNPDYSSGQTVQELRRDLYRILTPAQVAVVRFYTEEGLEKLLTARIESLDSSIFAKDPNIQISLVAHQPHFRGRRELTITDRSQGVGGVDYPGNIPWGYNVDVSFLKDVSWIEIINHSRPGSPSMRISRNFRAWQHCLIDIRQGSKEALITDANYTPLNRVTGWMRINGGWPYLYEGQNLIQITTHESNAIRSDITYRDYYGGF